MTLNRPRFHKSALAAALSTIAAPGMAQLILEEVVVTAQKRESTVQEIASTVNVVTAESLQRFSTLTFDDLEAQVSGLSLDTPNARAPNIALRGVAIDPESGADGTVDVYLNDQFVNLSIAFTQLYDLERIEVLRGPQGSLQGRSAPGGAINILTAKADVDVDEADGYVQLTAGDNDGLNTQFAYGAPIIDGTWGLRVAGVYDTNDYNGIENPVTGLDDGEDETYSARLSSTWHVTDSISTDISYQYLDRETDDPFAVAGTDSLGERPTLTAEDETALADRNNFGDFEFDLINWQIQWDLDKHELIYVGGWSDQTREYLDENDRANYVDAPGALTHQGSVVEQEMWSHEVRFNSTGNDTWDYMLGFYYQDQDVTADFGVNTAVTLPPETPVLGEYQFSTLTRALLPITAEQWSIFTFHNFYLADDLRLDFGLRYTDYDKTRSATVDYVGLSWTPDVPGLDPDFQELVLAGLDEQVESLGGFPIEGISEENQDSGEDAFTGSLTLRWDVTGEVSVYAGYYTSYRPSGTSIIPAPEIAYLPEGGNELLHDEEESQAIELGFKGRFLDNRASLNGSLYYQVYDDYLGFVRNVEVYELDDNGDQTGTFGILPGGWIYNGDAITYGVEFEGQIILAETWNAGGSLSWNQGEWDDAVLPCNDPVAREANGGSYGLCDVDGENIGGQPEWSASLNSEYYVPMGEQEVYIRGLYKYTGERDNIDASAGVGDVTDDFSAYNVVDMFLGVRSANFSWDANIFVKNLFDEDELILQAGPDKYDQEFSGGSYTRTNILNERTIGIMGRLNF